MQWINGIGGFFFRARDPESLGRWYSDRFGLPPVPKSYDDTPWRQAAGTTIFAPFAADTDYFGGPEQQFMINFRVSDLDGLVAALGAAGETVEVDPDPWPNGRFARLCDPEGNPIQLWQPGGVDPG